MWVERIKELRKRSGDSQEVFAEKCGVSRVTVSRWESGERVPDADAIRALSDAYGVTTDWLLGRSALPDKTHNDMEILTVKTGDPEPVIPPNKIAISIKVSDKIPDTLDELREFVNNLIAQALQEKRSGKEAQ